MRAAFVLLALVACGMALAPVAADAEVDQNLSSEEFDAMPFTPQQSEHDEAEVSDAAEESEASDAESDAADALEGNTEFDGAFLQAADEKVKAKTVAVTVVKGKGKGKGKAKKAVRAPAALKSAPSAPSAPFRYHPERVSAATTGPADPELEKLDLALAAVKEDILSTNKQITDERKWVIAVAKIIAAYNDKMKRVEAHIIALRKEMKSLYRKKKQIENLKLQRALEAKLKEAKAELATLIDSLKHVASKRGELHKSGAALRNTIAGIEAQLRKLRGQSVRKPRKPRAAPKAKRAAKRAGKGKKARRGAKRAAKRV